MHGKGAESGTPRPPDKEVTDAGGDFRTAGRYLAKAAADPATIRRDGGHPRITSSGSTPPCGGWRRMRAEAEPQHLDALLQFAARAYRRPLSQAERDDMLAFYHTLREKNGCRTRRPSAIRIVSVLMSPDFCYRIDLLDRGIRDVGRSRGCRAAAPRPSALRLRAGQPAELFPLVQHARRGVAGARRGGRSAEAGRAARADPPHAEGRPRRAAWPPSSAATGSISAASRNTTRSIASASPASTTSCARRCSRSRSASSRT